MQKKTIMLKAVSVVVLAFIMASCNRQSQSVDNTSMIAAQNKAIVTHEINAAEANASQKVVLKPLPSLSSSSAVTVSAPLSSPQGTS